MTYQPPSIVSAAQLDALAALARRAPEGDFAEVGVYQGGSAYVLYKIAITRGSDLHLFDTFSGTPVFTEGLDKHKIDREFAAEEAPQRLRQVMPMAKFYIGIYPQTHPENLPPLAFVHCDCDQYLSVKAVIDHMWPLLVPGGIMIFDDYPYLLGAKRAVEEVFPPKDLRLAGQRYYAVKPSD